MSDTVLSNRWVVYYSVENRQKRVYRDTSVSPTTTDTVRSLYSALQDLFDELTQMDDGTPMKYQTPTEYTIGIIDAGDSDPWFIDKQSVEYLTGGALATASWARVEGSNTGIIRVPRTGTNIVEADIGYDIVGDSDSDSGTLLDVQGSYLWIRPDSSAAANSFDNTSQNLTCNSHTDAQNGAPATGEMLWANIYSLGTIEADTHLYIYQNGSNLVAYKGTSDWWGDEHIDILVCVREVGSLIDEGYITAMARQYSKTYSYYIVDLSSGGRNPIPLQTGDDLNNTTGYRQMVVSDATGDFTEGEVIRDDGGGVPVGIVTSCTGTAPNLTIQYYLIGDPISTDFSAGTGSFTGETSTESATAVAPTNVGPAALAGLSITHANTGQDVDENGTNELYSITIDCSDERLSDVYEWTKYITRRGDTGTGNTDGIEGEQYLGSDYRCVYTTLNNTVSEGAVVYQYNGGWGATLIAKGTVVAHHTTDKILIIRNSRGTFNSTDTIYVDASNYVTTPTSTAVTPIGAAPYGTFAGGKFFCAPGVVLTNIDAQDNNNYQLTDDEGNVVTAPVKVSVTVGNSRAGDRIAVFRLDGAGGDIQKDTYGVDAAQPSVGETTVVAATSINVDEPGKTAGGIVRVVSPEDEIEDRYRFSSWTGATFTLAAVSGVATSGDADTLVDSGATFSGAVLVGDIVYNIDEDTYGYVTSVVGDTQLEITSVGSDKPATDWNGDTYMVNGTVRDYTTSGTIYVPLIDAYETEGTDVSAGSESSLITYDSNIPVRIRARHAGDIVPYEADSTVTAGGMSNNIIRTSDTVYT